MPYHSEKIRKRSQQHMLWKKKRKINKLELDMQIQSELRELTKNLEKAYIGITDNGKALKKYSYSMDEVIDMMEQMMTKEKEEKEREADTQEQINQLREVVLFYQEQTYRVNHILSEDENWNSSVQIMEKDENNKLQKNGMSAINTTDTVFTYELHEAIEVVDTECSQQDGKIAVIYVPGLLYQGKVIRKAKVAVYRYSGNESRTVFDMGESKDANNYRD